MSKSRAIKEELEVFDANLAAAANYPAQGKNIEGKTAFHLDDWNGKSGPSSLDEKCHDSKDDEIPNQERKSTGEDRSEGQGIEKIQKKKPAHSLVALIAHTIGSPGGGRALGILRISCGSDGNRINSFRP